MGQIIYGNRTFRYDSKNEHYIFTLRNNKKEILGYIVPLEIFYNMHGTYYDASGFMVRKGGKFIFVTNCHVIDRYKPLRAISKKIKNKDIGYINLPYDHLWYPLDAIEIAPSLKENEKLDFFGSNCDSNGTLRYSIYEFLYSPLSYSRGDNSKFSSEVYGFNIDTKSNRHGMSGTPIEDSRGRAVGVYCGSDMCTMMGVWERLNEDDIEE